MSAGSGPPTRRCYTRRVRARRCPPTPGTSSGSCRCLLLHRLPSVRDGELVLSLPDQADSLALLLEHLGRGGRQVLFGHDEPGPRLQLDDVPGVWTEIDDAEDRAEGRALVRADLRRGSGEADLLW